MKSGGNNFPGLFRTKVIFQDFPGPRILKEKNPRRRGNPDEQFHRCRLHRGSGKFAPVPARQLRQIWIFAPVKFQ